MTATSEDPTIVAYEAVRAHERMLNEAVSRYEHAILAPLTALNGGAVVAFLTLLGALLGKDSEYHPNLWFASLAVAAWVAGLLAAAMAIHYAGKSQRDISATYRLMREGLDEVLFGANVAGLMRGPVPTNSKDKPGKQWPDEKNKRATMRADKRKELRTESDRSKCCLKWWRFASAVLFVIGTALALSAVVGLQA